MTGDSAGSFGFHVLPFAWAEAWSAPALRTVIIKGEKNGLPFYFVAYLNRNNCCYSDADLATLARGQTVR